MCTHALDVRVGVVHSSRAVRLFSKKLLAILDCPRGAELLRNEKRAPSTWPSSFDHRRECEPDLLRNISQHKDTKILK